MKKIIPLLIVSILCFNCVNKTPSLSEETYKKEQEDYEVLKEKLSGDKVAFFNENEEAIMKKIRLFKKLKDTATRFTDVNTDTLFFLKDVHLNAINYRNLYGNKGAQDIVFLPKGKNISKYYSFTETYKQLYSCEENVAEKCDQMKTKTLKSFLNIKYAFVIDGFTIMEPSIDSQKSFKSGLFYGTVLVYDLVNNKPLFDYHYTATSSEQISYRENKNGFSVDKPIDVIKRDFKRNVVAALAKKTKKHFNFLERTGFNAF